MSSVSFLAAFAAVYKSVFFYMALKPCQFTSHSDVFLSLPTQACTFPATRNAYASYFLFFSAAIP